MLHFQDYYYYLLSLFYFLEEEEKESSNYIYKNIILFVYHEIMVTYNFIILDHQVYKLEMNQELNYCLSVLYFC